MASSAETDYGTNEQYDSESSDDSMENIIPDLSLVLFGNSSSVQFGRENLLLGEKQTYKENAEMSRIAPLQRKIAEYDVSVINMIDSRETEHVDNLIGQLVNEEEINAFIYIMQHSQLNNDDKMNLEWLQRVFGEKFLQSVMILFTYERENMSDTITDYLKRNPDLEQLLKKCGGYQTCSKMMNDQSEMTNLMMEIERLMNKSQLENSECISGHTSEVKPNPAFNFVLLGERGAGKSASGNTILGEEAFISKKSSKLVTQDVVVKSGTVDGFPVTVYDTPGFSDPKMSSEELQQMIHEKVLQKCESGFCAFLLVIKADRFNEEERRTVEKIEKLLGEKHQKNTYILFTRGDDLEDNDQTVYEFISDSEQLPTLVQKYEERFHVFNNKDQSSDQARLLLATILQEVQNGETLTRQKPKRAITHDEQQSDVSLSSTRIVLVGKTGFGKSASGNTILGEKTFESTIGTKSETRKCSKKHATVSGRSVTVVDTPGLFDTKMKLKPLMIKIAKSVYLSSPGPHAFLIVFRVTDRYTEHEQQIPQMIEIMFGKEVLKYSMILFTHGDQLEGKTIEELINENWALRDLVQKCGGRFHVFDNRDKNNTEQVNDLLQKIDSMIEKNGGDHYSNQMFEDAQRFREEEEKRIQREREETERKQQEEKQRQTEFERLRMDLVGEMESLQLFKRARPSENPEFEQFFRKHRSNFGTAAFAFGSSATGIGRWIGLCIGGAVCIRAIAGPVGTVVGAVVSTAVGGIVELLLNIV